MLNRNAYIGEGYKFILMSKRVLIFSPEMKDREELEDVVREYFKKNFGNYYTQIDFQKYSMLREPVIDNQLGHWGAAEIFTIFDQRLCSSKHRFKGIEKTPYYQALGVSYKISLKLCNEKQIPYIIYKGEITKKEEKVFATKLESVKDKIKSRLEGKVQ